MFRSGRHQIERVPAMRSDPLCSRELRFQVRRSAYEIGGTEFGKCSYEAVKQFTEPIPMTIHDQVELGLPGRSWRCSGLLISFSRSSEFLGEDSGRVCASDAIDEDSRARSRIQGLRGSHDQELLSDPRSGRWEMGSLRNLRRARRYGSEWVRYATIGRWSGRFDGVSLGEPGRVGAS